MDDFAFLDKMYGHPQAAVCAKKTSSMTMNIQRRLMQLHKVYE